MKKVFIQTCIYLLIILIIVIGICSFMDRRYNLVSIIIAILACVPFYYAYEKKQGNIRRMVLIALMTSLAVIGRTVVLIPGFKPVSAVVILVGIYMGPEAGFLCGSLSAIVSNIFFGQGPWTPFQMVAWGSIGFIAGISKISRILTKKVPLCFFGILSGIIYSLIMDLWTVLSFDGTFETMRYGAAIVAAIPFTIEYALSNIIFLLILNKPVSEKLLRIKQKHEII